MSVLDQKEYALYTPQTVTVAHVSDCIRQVANAYKYDYGDNFLSCADATFVNIYIEPIFDDAFEDEEIKDFFEKWGKSPETFISIQCSSGAGVNNLAIHFAQAFQKIFSQSCFYAAENVKIFDYEIQDMISAR